MSAITVLQFATQGKTILDYGDPIHSSYRLMVKVGEGPWTSADGVAYESLGAARKVLVALMVKAKEMGGPLEVFEAPALPVYRIDYNPRGDV